MIFVFLCILGVLVFIALVPFMGPCFAASVIMLVLIFGLMLTPTTPSKKDQPWPTKTKSKRTSRPYNLSEP